MSTNIDELVRSCIPALGESGASPDDEALRIAALVADPMMARRLLVWIPEAFGFVLASHIGKIKFTGTFSAKNKHGQWVTLAVEREPIFAAALTAAMTMFHSGPRESFKNISGRSALLNAVDNALNAGQSLDGAMLSGPALIGIPAEVYVRPPVWWRRLFG
jgi:hypothetical protein